MRPDVTTTLPLQGIRILDFTQMMAGPFATQILADLGAQVIKVEKIHTGEWERGLASLGEYVHGQSPFFLAMNRGKQSVAIDLKNPESLPIIHRLVRDADVVINNFRPGAMDRLGLSPEALHEVNPGLIYVNSTGYGASGPFRGRPGQDLLLQAISGLAAHSGPGDRPPTPLANSIVDATTALYNVIAVLAGLIGRGTTGGTGTGSTLDVNMLSSALAIQCQELFAHMNLGQRFERSHSGLACPWNAAPYGIYPVADGHLALGMADNALLARLLDSAELADLAAHRDPFTDRDAFRAALADALIGRQRDATVDLLLQADVWCAPVLDFDEVVDLAQVAENESFIDLQHPAYGSVRATALPIRIDGRSAGSPVPPPMPGEHTDQVLRQAGFDAAEIEHFTSSGLVSSWMDGESSVDSGH